MTPEHKRLASSARLLLSSAAWALLAACGEESPEPQRQDIDASAAEDAALDGADAPEEDAAADAAPEAPPTEVLLLDDARITSEQDQPNFQNVTAAFTLPAGPWADARLVVALRSTCYPFEQWRDDPPPAGHNWPASCDAFDRNFEFTLDDPQGPEDPPGIELVRAITPFGGPMDFEVDVTDLANALPGEHTLRAHITTWGDGEGRVSGSRGGWNVSARLVLTPGEAPRRVLAVIPLYNGSLGADQGTQRFTFTLPEGTTAARLEYRTTGHGGAQDSSCIGPAEEFCERTHRLLVDGSTFTTLNPWRDTCEPLCTLATTDALGGSLEYCEQNPCGAISSVRAPRANWCPGDITPPFTALPDAWATPGEHAFGFAVAGVKPGGSWRTSAVVFALGDPE